MTYLVSSCWWMGGTVLDPVIVPVSMMSWWWAWYSMTAVSPVATSSEKIVCHFLNYARYPDPDDPIERAPVEVSLDASIPVGGTPTVLTPDAPRRRPRVGLQRVEGRTVLTLSRLRIYSVVVLDVGEPSE